MNNLKTIEEVQEIIDSFYASGMPKREYAESIGLTKQQLYWYFRRIRNLNNKPEEKPKINKSGFRKIKISNPVFQNNSITIKYGKLEILIPESSNIDNLKQIINALEIDIHA